MRVAIAGIGLLLLTTPALAQSQPCGTQVSTYDPYKPSDLAIVREYGGTVMSQAPLSTLLKLDPYVPSQGELLRQVGRGIPLYAVYGWPVSAPPRAADDCAPAPQPSSTPPAPLTSFAEVLAALQRAPAAPAAAMVAPSASATEKRTGVWIHYGGRAWVSAGSAIPLRNAEFTRVGESAGFPVFRRSGAKDDLIFVATTTGMVAPFRATP